MSKRLFTQENSAQNRGGGEDSGEACFFMRLSAAFSPETTSLKDHGRKRLCGEFCSAASASAKTRFTGTNQLIVLTVRATHLLVAPVWSQIKDKNFANLKMKL